MLCPSYACLCLWLRCLTELYCVLFLWVICFLKLCCPLRCLCLPCTVTTTANGAPICLNVNFQRDTNLEKTLCTSECKRRYKHKRRFLMVLLLLVVLGCSRVLLLSSHPRSARFNLRFPFRWVLVFGSFDEFECIWFPVCVDRLLNCHWSFLISLIFF